MLEQYHRFESFLKMKVEEGPHDSDESSVGDYLTLLDPNGDPLEDEQGNLFIPFEQRIMV